jgi:hypothetical protein
MPSLVYQPPSSCSAGKERFTSSKIDKCDPFAGIPPPTTIDSDFLLNLIAGVLGTVAVFVGIYFALKYGTKPEYADKIKGWGEAFGRQLAKVRGSPKKVAALTAASTKPSKPSISDRIDAQRRSWRRKTAPAAIQAEIQRRERDQKADERLRAKRRATAQNAIAAEMKKRDQEQARVDAAKKKLEEERKRRQAIQTFKDAEADAAKKKAEEEEAARKKAVEEEAARDKARRKSLMTYRSPTYGKKTRRNVPPPPVPPNVSPNVPPNVPPKKPSSDDELPIRIKREPRDTTQRKPRPPPVIPPTRPINARIVTARQRIKDIQAKVEARKKEEDRVEQETKERLSAAKKRIAEITDETKKRKFREELQELEDKRKKMEEDVQVAKEKAVRDLEEARIRLRISQESLRKARKNGGGRRKHRSKQLQ